MRRLSSAVKVGIIFILLLVGGYVVWKTIGQTPSGESNFVVWARFTDASGLPQGSKVVIAGLPVGEISDLAIDGRYARITMRIRDDVPLFDNAIAFKKSSSLLGSYYIEIDPGSPTTVDARGLSHDNRRLKTGDQILHVVEATSPDELMKRIEETLPKVDSVLLSVRDLSEDVRSLVNGPLRSTLDRVDTLVGDETQRVHDILTNIDDITGEIRGATNGADAKVQRILDNLDKASADAHNLVSDAQKQLDDTAQKVRDKLDSIDSVIQPTSSVMKKVDEDKGTLGRLVNDSTIADNIEDITESAKGFLGTLFGMQTYVGLRSEYTFGSGDLRSYVTLELRTRPDKFYYIELEKGPRGDYPDINLTWDPTVNAWRQNATIQDKLRFTFQFAKQLDWLTLRYGIKESTGGIGADASWFDDHLKISADVFDATFDQLPRVKLTAAYQMFGFLYVLGGVDELLNAPHTLDVIPVNDPGGVPTFFRHFRYGRDFFAGAMLRFNDLDLAALLTVGGAALTSVAQ